MTGEIVDFISQVLIALGSGVVAGLVAWGGLRVEIRFIRRAIEAAHDRLDEIGAPPARFRFPDK